MSESAQRSRFVKLRDTAVPAALGLAGTFVAVVAAVRGYATWLEAWCFVTGAVCVWLAVRESVWNFPIGLLNVSAYAVVFAQGRLYADAGLQVVYFGLGLAGWYAWTHGRGTSGARPIARAAPRELAITMGVAAVFAIALSQLLVRVGGAAPVWDAVTTSISLASQWLLNRKRLENWIGWIIVDAIYVPLYVSRGLYLTAFLYAVFLAMATFGFLRWRENLRR